MISRTLYCKIFPHLAQCFLHLSLDEGGLALLPLAVQLGQNVGVVNGEEQLDLVLGVGVALSEDEKAKI